MGDGLENKSRDLGALMKKLAVINLALLLLAGCATQPATYAPWPPAEPAQRRAVPVAPDLYPAHATPKLLNTAVVRVLPATTLVKSQAAPAQQFISHYAITGSIEWLWTPFGQGYSLGVYVSPDLTLSTNQWQVAYPILQNANGSNCAAGYTFYLTNTFATAFVKQPFYQAPPQPGNQ